MVARTFSGTPSGDHPMWVSVSVCVWLVTSLFKDYVMGEKKRECGSFYVVWYKKAINKSGDVVSTTRDTNIIMLKLKYTAKRSKTGSPGVSFLHSSR